MHPKQHIAELAPLFRGLGIRRVVICPGSRNAPLIQRFTSDIGFRCHSIVDERSAGYIALGMARQSGETVAVVTTSGTATLNLAPAVAEAHSQRIPLLVLTADRPLEVIPVFNNQWIDQEAPYYSYSKGFLQLPFEVCQPEDLDQLMDQVEGLTACAQVFPRGPVHINVPLAEPLYEKLPDPILNREIKREQPVEDASGIPPHGLHSPELKILVLAGMGAAGPGIAESLGSLVRSRQAVVIAENIANLPGEGCIPNPELLLAWTGTSETGARETGELVPDRVVSFGGQVVSKRLNRFLQSAGYPEHIEIQGDMVSFLGRLEGPEPPAPGFVNHYLDAWKEAERRALGIARMKLAGLPFGNFYAIHRILSAAPAGSVIHLGNSAAIRYSQAVPLRGDLSYYSNRGTSGIDGCLSSAVGAALVSSQLHILLVGDLSFVYDSNALWNKEFPENLKIIVLNDGGGGIFRLLDGPSRMDFFEEFLVTHHPVSIELLVQAFGRNHRIARSAEELDRTSEELFTAGSTLSVIEVETAGCENSRIFKDFFDPGK